MNGPNGWNLNCKTRIFKAGIYTLNDYNLCLFLVFPSLCFTLPLLYLPYCRALKVKGRIEGHGVWMVRIQG